MFLAFASGAALQSLANTADNVQSLEARMGQMTQTVGAAGETFDAVSKHATDARQNLSAYANLYIRIGNASQDLIKDQAELLGIIDTVSQALVVGGVASSEQGSAMLQLSQAFNKGKLDGDEFKSVMEAMPPAFTRNLAAAMGYTDGLASFYEASSSGKLTIEALVKALKTIGPEISRQFVAMPLTISQAYTIIGNRFQTFIARLNRESGAVTNIANFFIGTFNQIEDGLEKLVDFFGGATPTLKFFGIALAVALAPLAFKLAAGAVMFLISPLGLLMAGLLLVGLALEDVYQWMTGGESIIGKFLGEFDTVGERFKGTIVTIKLLTAAVLVGGAIWAATMIANGTALAWLLATSTAGVIGFAATWTIAHASMAIATLIAYAPILLLIAALGLALGALYLLWDNWEEIMGWIKEAASGAWSFVSDQFMAMVDKIKGYWNSFKSFFGMGVSTTISTATAAGAASSAGGVPTAAAGGNTTIQINQELPPGTPEETRQAAYNGTKQAMADNEMAKFARQAGQAQ